MAWPPCVLDIFSSLYVRTPYVKMKIKVYEVPVFKMNDEGYMRLALEEAQKAHQKDEVPVGAVVVRDGKVIAKAHNLRETKKDPLAHAELLAIKKAAKKLKGWRLAGCTLYITLEPCPMCAGAVVNARIPRVVYAAKDPKAGALGSVCDLNEGRLNHTAEVTSGVLKDPASALLKRYFKNKRKRSVADGMQR